MNIEIKISKKPVEYKYAMSFLEKRVQDIQINNAKELIWILEHEDIYTCGTSGKDNELLNPKLIPSIKTNRGGKWTYHGKGQKVVYFVLNLNSRGKEIKKLVRNIEKWIIQVLKALEINSYNDPNNVGIWVKKNNLDYKIAAIGIKVKKWIAYHGFSLNINVNKDLYQGIIPCGITDKGILNITDVAVVPEDEKLNDIIIKKFIEIFIN